MGICSPHEPAPAGKHPRGTVPNRIQPPRHPAYFAPQPNVPNITAAPFYYTGGNTGRQNLATNVSITVSSRINGYSQLFSILNATAVASNISSNPGITDSESGACLAVATSCFSVVLTEGQWSCSTLHASSCAAALTAQRSTARRTPQLGPHPLPPLHPTPTRPPPGARASRG